MTKSHGAEGLIGVCPVWDSQMKHGKGDEGEERVNGEGRLTFKLMSCKERNRGGDCKWKLSVEMIAPLTGKRTSGKEGGYENTGGTRKGRGRHFKESAWKVSSNTKNL